MAVTRVPIPQSAKDSQAEERLDMSLAETTLCVRTINCLEEEGIFTVRDLLNCTRERLLGIPNFGQTTLKEVYRALAKLGFRSGG
jgi:DNA-directed RNA polymerase subunit alpha